MEPASASIPGESSYFLIGPTSCPLGIQRRTDVNWTFFSYSPSIVCNHAIFQLALSLGHDCIIQVFSPQFSWSFELLFKNLFIYRICATSIPSSFPVLKYDSTAWNSSIPPYSPLCRTSSQRNPIIFSIPDWLFFCCHLRSSLH